MTSPTIPEDVASLASVPNSPTHERTIVVLAPTGNDALLTQRVLSASGILVQICGGIAELCRAVEGSCAAIVLAEETLKTDAVLTLVESLSRQPTWSDLPVIIITSGGEADQARLRRLAVFGPGANVTLLERPFRPGTLLSATQAALRSRLRQYLTRDLLQEMTGLTKKIRDQARTFDATLSHITDFAYTFDVQGRFTYINKPLLDLWGLKLEQAVGKDFFELNYPPELAQKLQDQIQQVIRTGKSLTDETPYTNPAGQTGFYEYIFNPIFAPDGTVEAVAGSTRDISERKRIEAQLRLSEAAAAHASRAKDDFLAALSHELRTPLNPVLLIASDAADNPHFPSDARESFRVIEKNVLLEARLIDDLLDLTRITHNKLALEKQPLDLIGSLRDAIQTVRTELVERGLTLHEELVDTERRVMGDHGRLQQVFWNILKNSGKFTPDGGRISIANSVKAEANEMVIMFADTGIGMDQPELARIFNAFAQGDHASTTGSHRFGGLGLGLAISRKLIEMHQGRIEASSPGKGKGSTFTVYLPLIPLNN